VAGVIVLGVLVSGRGSNLQSILDAVASRTLDARVAVVISNVDKVAALDRAHNAGVEALVIDHRLFESRQAFDAAVVSALRARGAS
jgi:phosphoribosylglycinamide formyltransferase-1